VEGNAVKDIDTVRKHVLLLIDAGHSQRTIGEAARIPAATVDNILRRSTWVTDRTFAAIMSVEVRPPWETPGVVLKPRNKIPGTGTVRRLQALVRMGYSILEIAEAIELNEVYVRVLIKNPQSLVTVSTSAKVREFYRRALIRQPEGKFQERTRRWAESNGWTGPGGWDDIDHDRRPVRDGDLGVLVDYVEEHPGLTSSQIHRSIVVDLGMPVGLAYQLIKQALDTGEIVKIRRNRFVRVYTANWEEGDQNAEGHQVRQAAVSG
jgi:hypothetical protein